MKTDIKNRKDEEIVKQVLKGKIDLYEEIVERYEDKLKRYIMRIVNRSEEVDDILQDVFIKAYTNLRTFDTNMKFSSWIYRIAHNESVNLIKSSWIRKITSIDNFFNLKSDTDEEAKIDKKMMAKKLEWCMEKLDIKYREPLILFYLEEKSYDEISDIMRLPVRTIGVRVHRGREKLKEYCKKNKTND
jgi:RNA polymerase sigma-70 factor, ECF subfamily